MILVIQLDFIQMRNFREPVAILHRRPGGAVGELLRRLKCVWAGTEEEVLLRDAVVDGGRRWAATSQNQSGADS